MNGAKMTESQTNAPEQLSDTLKATDDAFFEALLTGELAALEDLLAEGFLIVDVAEGAVHSRKDFIGGIGAGLIVFKAIERFPDEAIVRGLGEDGAVVIGRTKMSIVAPDGSEIEASSRYTHVFRVNGDHWQLFSAQGTPIAEDAVVQA
jgi:ketosteroid isomerase-like protein